MEVKPYKLSCYLVGHAEDIKAIGVFDNGTFVSTSRDKTAIVWSPDSSGKGYTQKSILKGHTNFVNSVAVINSCPEYPNGCILTGGQDALICIYDIDDANPKTKIKAHKSNVCCLNVGHNSSTFLSSSWDSTARVWSLQDTTKPQKTLIGHVAAVWNVVAASNGRYITASADKSIIVWKEDGTPLKALSGHTDCARAISLVNAEQFLSCSNDATVRRWNINTGECIETYKFHKHFVYSLYFDPNTMSAFTSGESFSVKIWHSKDNIEEVRLPCQTVWCVRMLKNADIVTGTSDGIVRIFSRELERQLNAEELQTYEDEVNHVAFTHHVEIDAKCILDPAILKRPGNRDGHTIMVREKNGAAAYTWCTRTQLWDRVGEVLGQSGSSKPNKQMYNGEEYDYVFSIDIEDGAPPLKLPYNTGEDPWKAAQKFIHDNNLDQVFLEQVANFIIKNSGGGAPSTNVNNQFFDPFTGGSRYVPSSGNSSFGNSSFADNNPSIKNSHSLPTVSYIPQKSYLKLEQANTSAIFDKLRELNEKLTNDQNKVSQEELEKIQKIITEQSNESQKMEAIVIVKKMLEWPKESVFPILDIVRLLALKNGVNEQLCDENLIKIVKNHINPGALPANQMLTFRILANMFSCSIGESNNIQFKDEILDLLSNLSSVGNKQNQVAVVTYLLNLVVALNKQNDRIGRIKILNCILKLLPHFNDQESIFRILVAIGTLLSTSLEDNSVLVETVQQSETALSILTTISENTSDSGTSKLADCSEYIIKLIFQNA